MFLKSDTEISPWTVILSEDKRRSRIAVMRKVLSMFDYDGKDSPPPTTGSSAGPGCWSTTPRPGSGEGLRRGPQGPSEGRKGGRRAMTSLFDAYIGDMSGLPDPDRDQRFYAGVPSRRLAAWVVDVIVTLGIGVPLALVFGLMTLGVGLALFPLILLGVGFFYRVATIASGSATWGCG